LIPPATLLLIDAGLPDLQVLLAGVGPGVRPVLVGRDEDALEIVQREIQAAALTAAGVPARLALVAHGAAGAVLIGREPIERASLETRAAAWASLGQAALQSIDLFACHTGLDQSFVEGLSAITGCDVAASTTAVGSSCCGASWLLDVGVTQDLRPQSGRAANRVIPFSRAAQASWVHELATYYVGTPTSGNGIGSSANPWNQAGFDAAKLSFGDTLTVLTGTLTTTVNQLFASLPVNTVATRGALLGNENSSISATPGSVVAYGAGSTWSYRVVPASGSISFDNATFGDPISGTVKAGYAVSSLTTSAKVTGTYNISDFAAAFAVSGRAFINGANDLIATTAATVNQATVIEALTNSGTNTYDISDTSANLAASSNAVLTLAGTVAASNTATAAQATTIAGFAKAVTYSISDTAAAVAGAVATALNEAMNITATGSTTVAQATTIVAASNTGSNSYSLSDTAANLAAAAAAIGNGATTITATTAATLVQATAIDAFTNPGGNTYDIADTATNLAASNNTVVSKAGTVTASTDATFAQAKTISAWAKAVAYSISDTGSVIAADTTAASNAARNEAINISATTAGGSLTVVQATTIENATNTGTNSYTIGDSATNLVASSDAVLSKATYVFSSVPTLTQANTLSGATGTPARTTPWNIYDTPANLGASSNAVLSQAVNVYSSTMATVSEATQLAAFTKAIIFDISDTSTAIAAANDSVLNEARKIILTGTTAAADLNTLDARTTAPVDASAWTTVTGTAADVLAAYNSTGISGLGNEAVTLSGTTVAASDLNALDAKTSGTINATTVNALSGAAADVKTTYASNQISGLGNEAVTLSGSTSVADANSVDGSTTGAITATITETAISSLSGLTGTGNAYTISVTDASVDAAVLNTLDGQTTVTVNAGSVGTLTGTAAAIDTAINASTIDTGAAVAVNVNSGSATVAQANSIDAKTSGVVTATISEGDTSTLSGLTGTGNAYTISVTDPSVDAAALNTLDSKTTEAVNATAVRTLTGTAAAIDTAINASTIDTGSAVVVNVNSGNATVAQANSIDAQTTGVVTATISQGDLATLGSLSGTGNAYTATLSDTTAAASAVTTLDDNTTVAVNAGSVATLTGTAAEVNSAYSANTAGSISGLGDEAVTLSDTTLAATALNTVNSNTTGVVNAGSVTTLTGLLADVNSAYAANAANTINGLGDEAVTITNGTGNLLATDLSTAGNSTTGTVSVSNTQTVSGTVAEVTAALVTASTKVVMGTASTASISDGATAAQGAPIATTANVTAHFSLGIVDSLSNLASTGTISSNLASITADQPNVVITISNTAGGTVQATDLSAVGNASTGTVTVTNAQTVNGTADEVIAAVDTTASKVNLITGSTINASTYNTQDLSGVDAAFTLNVTTINGAVLDATKLATADSITLVGTNTVTGADADTLGSRLGGTATLNITTDPITANTDLSDLGSGLSLQFGGDTTAVVTDATLTIRQDQVSGYAISGTGTVVAAGTTNSDTFDASSITSTTHFTSLGGNDRVTMAPSALGSVDSIDGGSGSDTLTFSAAGTVVDGAFTYVSSVEILELAAGTNSITLAVEAEQAGISTVTGDTGADTLNLLYATIALTFNAGSGTDTLSYSADSAAQSITLSGISSGTAAGSVSNGDTDTFTGLESIVGGSGTADSITSTSSAEALIVTGANAGTIDGFGFSGVESVDLGAGNDTGTINTGGSLSGSLSFANGTDTLTYASYGSAVSSSLSGTNTLSSLTAISGGVTGVDNLTLSSSNDTLTVGSSGSLSGNLDFGAGSGDTLSYAGNANGVTVSLNGATSTAAAGATGITGTTTGFETLIGGSGSSDILIATSGGNAVSVASDGTTTLDTSLTVSGFETINLGANADASADTATISGAFGGTVDLGDGGDTATINDGGSITSLVGGAGSGDTLNLDGAIQTITVTGTGNGTTAGTSGGTTIFSGFENVNGQGGADAFTVNSASSSTISVDGSTGTDSLSVASSDTAANSLTISGVSSGTLGNVTFSGIESIALAAGGDTATVSTGGSLSGNLDLGAGTNSLTLSSDAGSLGSVTSGSGADTITINDGSITGALSAGDGSNSLTVSGTSSSVGSYIGGIDNDSLTLGGGRIMGDVTLGDGTNILLISSTYSLISGSVSFGSGTTDTLSYADYSKPVTVSLADATSTAAGAALGITGAVSGFESLMGGSGSDTLNAASGANSLNVASNGTTLDTSLTVSGFETINLGANSDASSDTATFSTAFSGSVDLGAGNDTATINTGGSVTNLAGGSGSDTLNFDGGNNTITVSGSGNGTDGTTSFSSFETLNLTGGNDTATVNAVATITIDGGAGSDTLQVASTDTANNSLTLSGVGGGVLGNVTFLNQESVSLGSGGDTVLLANGSSLAGNLNLGGGSNSLQIGQVGTGLTSDQATFWTTTDNYSETYLNGTLVGSTNNWGSPFSFNLTGQLLTGNNVIAVASHDSGGIAGMQAQLVGANNSVLFGSSNPGWKFSLSSPSGWQNASFDDSSWSSPTVGSQTAGPWGNKMPVNDGSAGWIWSPDPNGDDNVYFRYSFNYIPPGSSQSGAVSLGSLSGGSGADTVSLINGIVSGAYNAGDGANALTISGSASSVGSYTGGSGNDTVNLSGGEITGDVSTGAGDDRLVLADPGSSVSGAVDFGSGSADTLSYAGNSAAASVTLSGANSIAAAGATGIGGSVSGLDVLVGGNGSDSLTAQAGSNTFIVSSGGVVNLDTSLTVSGFETISLGAGVDTANLQGGYSGALDLGAGTDTVTLESGGSASSIAGGSEADTLNFNASANSVSFGASGSGSGQSTNFTGFETVNLLGGNDSASFNGAFAGSVELGDGNDTATINTGSSTTALSGGAGTDSLNSNSAANSLSLSGADAGSVDGTAFNSFEAINLAAGNDTVTVAAGGSLSGNLNLGDDSNSLTLQADASSLASVTGGTGSDTVLLQGGSITGALNAGDGSNSLTVSGSNASVGSYQGGSGNDAITLNGGTIFGNVDLGSGANSLLISSTNSSIGGSVSFGSGSADALSYAGYGTALNLTLNTATSLAAVQAPGVMGAVSGFENLTGTSNSDSINAASGSNSLVVAADGTTSLDGLNLSSFESINLGANSDASADSVTLSGSFSGSIDLGAGNDTGTINGGGASSLAGGSGTDTLNFNGSANSLTIAASGSGSSGSTSFSGFETISTLAGDDTITLGSAATTTQTLDGGDDTDLLQVASSDSSNNTLTLTSAGGGSLGGVSFTNIENITLASGSDSVTLASGGGLASRQPGLLADFYNKSGAGVAGSLLRTGVVLGPVNVQDQTLQSLVGKSDQVYLFAQGFLTVPGSGSYNDFILSTTSDDGVRVKIDLAGTGAFSNVINNYTDHGPTVDNSSPQLVSAGQRIPIQIEWFESGGGATLELYYQSSSQGIGRTLVPLSNLSFTASSSVSGSLDLGAGDDTITFQYGSIGVASLAGGTGTDVLNFASYGSGVSVDLASGSSTGTSGISGFERVIGSSANDTLIASTSDANLLVGNDGDDSFGFTISGLTSADTVQGGTGRDTLVFSTAGTINESQFSNVSSVEQVALNGASSFNLGTASQTVGVDTVLTGSGTTTVSTTIAGYDLAVDANSLANNTSVTLSGSSTSNDFVVSNLKGDLVASSTSGSFSVTTGDNTVDNTISITIGIGATTITGGAGGDTLSIDTGLAAQNSTLTLAGSSNQSLTNLVADISATTLSGSLTVTTSDATDNGISIATGSNSTTINASGAGDSVTVNANAMADNTTLTLNGSATETVSNLQANTNASGSSAAVNLSYKDVADNAASISTGSAATTVSGSSNTDTLTVNAFGLTQNTTLTQSGAASQAVTNLVGDINATNLSGTLNVTTGNAGDDGINITTGSNNTIINASGSGDTVIVNANAMADNTTLTINGSAAETVSNLQANANASGSSGAVNLSYNDVADNAATISTGSGATTVSGSSSDDTLNVNAAALGQNTSLTLTGSSLDVVTNLVGDISATTLSGSLNVTTGDAGDQGIAITTGSANTTINASGSGDTVTVNANAMADYTSLTLTGSATETVNNLQANVTASGTSGAVNLSYKDVADNAATISTGSGTTSVAGSSNSDTLTINASSLAQNTTLTASGSANQVMTNLVGDISATNLSGTLNVTTGDAADNGISLATGSGATTINASGSGDTVNTNAVALAQDTSLTLTGTAKQTVTNLVGDVAATNSSGTLTLTTADAANDGINIAIGSNNAYINGTASSDTLSIDASALAQSSSVNLQGSSAAVVTNLVGDLNGYLTTSALGVDSFNSATGWTNGTIYSGSSYYGNVLGLYANGTKTNGQDTSKTFDLGGQATTLSFDFARIDSWDGEMFRVYIDDSVAFDKSFQYGVSIGNSTGTTGAYSWSIAAKDNLGSYAGVSSWTDQTARISIEIPAGKYNTKIGFGSTLNQVVDDESYAIDNLTVPTSSISNLSGPLTITTGDALDNAINIATGSGATTVNASGTGDTVTVNADAMVDNSSLTLTGSATETVNNLQANTNASGSTGVVTLNYKDVADNAANISTGSGATTVSSSTSGDTLSIDAAALAQNTSLTLTGSSQDVVSNLVGDLNATSLSGSLNVTTGDVGDQGIAITTGSANTTITASGAGDTVTVNANAMADNTTLTLIGSAAEMVSNLQANTNASGTSGAVNLSYKDVADNAATITTGSGATTVSGSSGTDTLSIIASALAQDTTLIESGSANQVVTGLVGDISATNLSGTLNVTTGDATDNGINIATGSNNTTINASGAADAITVDGNAMADNTTLTLTGSATETVTNLQANTNASSSSGAVSLSYKDVADNAATITTGSGATTVGGSSSTDTLSVNAGNLPQNRLLSLFGAAKQLVNNLVGNLIGDNASLTTLSGSLTVNAGDALDNGISITTGTGDTTITASGTGDTISVDAAAMADNKTLTLSGTANETVTKLQANTDAATSSGALNISYGAIDDQKASLTVGTGSVVVSGGVAGDTISVAGLNTDSQTFFGLDASSNLSITAGAGSQLITASNVGNDSIDGGAGSDTLSFAGGSNVTLSITVYSNQAGAATGQGTDQFRAIESLQGATGTDVLRGIQSSSTNEVLTITGSNSGTMADAAGSGSFSFSSFEQADLAGGNDVLRITGSSSLSGTADGGEGSDLLDYSAYSASGVVVDLSKGKATAINLGAAEGLVANDLGFSSFEKVTGTSANDQIVGDGGANLLLGGAGNDSLDGGAGSDTLNGGSGDDLVEGGSGDDLIIASWGNDTIRGSGGATGSLTPIGEVDRVSYAELGVGFDVNLSGIDGATLKLDNNASLTADQIINNYQPLSETLSAPTNQVSTDYTQVLSGIQQIVLSDFNDVVRIHSDDYLTGRSNASGGASSDQTLILPLNSAGSSLTLDGGVGELDVLDYSSFDSSSPVYVNLSSSKYQFDVNSNGNEELKMGDITLVNGFAASRINVTTGSTAEGGANGISGFEVVIGGAGDDAIVGNEANNILVGNGGNNRLAGGAGNDTIFGGTGNDFITPGTGADLVMPGGGINTILATSDDMDNDQFILDKRALNFVKLQGNGLDKLYENEFQSNTFDPGLMGINILAGGDPVSKKDPVTQKDVTTYDSMQGTGVDDAYNFTTTVLKNIEAINMGAGDDVVFTAPTVKGVTVLYDGGGHSFDGDTINLNFTFADFRKLNQGGRYTLDLQPYLDNPFSNVLQSTSLDMKASSFEKATISAIAPGIYNSLPGDPAAITFNAVFGINETTITSGDALTLSGSAVATSGADASSAKDIVSAFVQANDVMGANKVSLDAGTDLSGGSTATNMATATAITGDDRSDTVLSAYATGANLSDFNAGRNITLNLSGSSDGVAKAQTIGYIANAASTVDVAGSSDSSLSAGQNLTLTAQGLATQDVQASNVQGVSLATLASRSAGITDPNLPGSSADGLTAGQTLNLTAKAAATNSVLSQGTSVDQIGTFNLVGSGTAAANDYLQSSLVGDQFPLINGDRIRFSTAGGGVLADRDYWVFNRNAFTGTFQISAFPGGEPVEISADAALGVYRPADALADALASSTAVQLTRTGVGNEALQAGSGLGLNANASQVLTISASSVDGAAAAGLNRVGSFEGMDMATRSLVVAQQATSAAAAGPASLDLTASLRAGLEARTVADRADSEANAAVVATDSSSTISGQTLTIKAAASNSLSSTATSTDGSAQARSGAGAGAGIDLAVDLVPDATSAQGGSYGASRGLVNASQQAGGNLAITATASSEQRAVATTVGGSRTLDAASASSAGYLLIPNNELADGDPIRLSAAGGSGLSTSTTYRAGSLGFTVELDPTTGNPTNRLTSNSGISYVAGDVIHFRLNSNTAHNDGNDASGRSGINLGTTYYVLGGGTSFEVATSAAGSPVTLTADTVGSADTLLDADRIRLLEPIGSGQAYRQASIITSNGTTTTPITLLQPSAAIALAGGRDADTVLSLADANNSAVVSGIDGQADQAGTILPGTIRSLTAGEDASLSGLANGVVTAAATNTAGAAIASGSQIADGLKDMAITAGSDGTITARGTLSGTVDATTVGMPDQSADALANLNLSATGVAQTLTAEPIRIGGNGVVQSDASLAGRSTASTVSGNSDALANLQADALKLDVANTISVGQQGSVNATASIGTSVAPLLVSAVSAGAGNATSQMGLEASGILGSAPTPGTFSLIEFGGGPLGTVGATGQGVVDLRATATDGASSTTLGSTGGGGSATITGIRDTALTIGADLARITATASGLANLKSLSVGGDATASGATTTSGILSDDSGVQVGINVANQGQIAALASQKSVASATSVSGQASSSLSNSSVALQSVVLNLGGSGQLRAEALTDLLNRSESVSGSASA
jgi:Ca2+-binding RTX toxin-like protein